MTYQTTLSRGFHDKALRAKTIIVLGFDRRELHIETSKAVRGGIESDATVYQRTEDGMGLQHAFGLAGGGDYSARLRHDPTGRATEKALRTMHEAALMQADEQVRKVRAFYGQPAAEPIAA